MINYKHDQIFVLQKSMAYSGHSQTAFNFI